MIVLLETVIKSNMICCVILLLFKILFIYLLQHGSIYCTGVKDEHSVAFSTRTSTPIATWQLLANFLCLYFFHEQIYLMPTATATVIMFDQCLNFTAFDSLVFFFRTLFIC